MVDSAVKGRRLLDELRSPRLRVIIDPANLFSGPEELVRQNMAPLAFVVLNTGFDPSDSLASELKQWVKSRLAPYKYPRWIQFSAALPKTATGKIQRFKLRD